jgi:hypothetical protein
LNTLVAGVNVIEFTASKTGSGAYLKSVVVAASNFSCTHQLFEAGEVAAYTPQSIGGGNTGSWFDTTSNRNHGAVSGATEVNPLKLGPMEIGGDYPDMVNLRYDAADSVPLQIQNRNKTTGDTTLIRWKHEDGNSTSGYYPVELGTEIANADARKADFKIFVSDGDNVNRSADCRFYISNAGDVRATSAASTNLKQVARMHSKTVVVNTGTALAYTVTHNLGTRGIITSAQDANNEFVEVHVDAASDDTAVFTFASASAVASDENFIFTIMGGGAPEAA